MVWLGDLYTTATYPFLFCIATSQTRHLVKDVMFNKMKYIFLNKIYINLQQFQVIPKNKTQGSLINYIPNVHDKKDDKDKESKIVKKCLRWINL